MKPVWMGVSSLLWRSLDETPLSILRIGECVKHAQNRVGIWIRFFVVNTVTKKFQTKQTQGELPAGIRGDLGQRVEGRVIGTLLAIRSLIAEIRSFGSVTRKELFWQITAVAVWNKRNGERAVAAGRETAVRGFPSRNRTDFRGDVGDHRRVGTWRVRNWCRNRSLGG